MHEPVIVCIQDVLDPSDENPIAKALQNTRLHENEDPLVVCMLSVLVLRTV